jgi:uncharacterized membrane protein YgdD (TMEM256/DUF423 family)
MDSTINSVVNNFADRIGEITTATTPAIESANKVAQIVIQETSNVGFMYCMIGAVLACLSLIFIIAARKTSGWAKELLTMGIVLFPVISFVVIMCNLSDWFAPTRSVIREIINNF